MRASVEGAQCKTTTCIGRARRDKFRRALFTWAESNLRDFPWRHLGISTYGILVAELLLKRTTATAAARLYGSFIEKYPSIGELALASEDQLVEALEPIGLSKQRARAIQQLALALTQCHEGLPTSLDLLRALPSIGDYAARAILSFGYDVPMAVVDSNVERVIGRAFYYQPGLVKNRKAIQKTVDALLPRKRHRDFNFALLDLGSLICRPAKPLCSKCPLRRQCDYALQPASVRCDSPLRRIRKEKGFSLLDLASKAGVSKLTVINIEAGRAMPRPETLTKIANAMGVSIESIRHS